MSPRVFVALAAAAACSLAALAVLPAHSAQRSQCQRLRGVDRAPDRHVKLVKRPSAQRLKDGSRGSRLVGCVLPRGLVYTIATRRGVEEDFAQDFDYLVRQVAGGIVLLDQRGGEGGYQSDLRTMVWDVGSGRSYTVARRCDTKYGFCTPQNTSAVKAIITRQGRSVAALEHWFEGMSVPTIVIARFAADGTVRVLDTGPPAELAPVSLSLSGNIATWTHAGEARSADIGVSESM